MVLSKIYKYKGSAQDVHLSTPPFKQVAHNVEHSKHILLKIFEYFAHPEVLADVSQLLIDLFIY